jgi:hypothetical protein
MLQSSHRRPAAGFVDGLLQAAVERRAVRHPYLRALADGELPDVGFALADFARQYPLYAKWFPRYLAVVAGKLSDADHREPLLANLREERGFLDDEALGQLAAVGIAAGWVERRSVCRPPSFACANRETSPDQSSVPLLDRRRTPCDPARNRVVDEPDTLAVECVCHGPSPVTPRC